MIPQNTIALEAAAVASRLPHDKMTREEVNLFQDILDKTLTPKHIEKYKMFIYIRNKILQLWVDNPKVQLVIEDVLNKFETPISKNEKVLITRIFKYLERYSYINFGVFKRLASLPAPRGKVIVIGAGIAGIMAARQLKEFGFEVVVYEARDRIGGRIATFRKAQYVADLGAMVVTGLGGNPLAILSKQISMDLIRVKPKCPLYDTNGKIIQKERDEIIEQEFNKLLEATSYLTHNLDFDPKIDNKPISLGHALELIIKLQESFVKKKQVEFYSTLNNYQKSFKEKTAKLVELKEKIVILTENLENLKANIDINQEKIDPIDKFNLLSCQRDLKAAYVEHNQLTAQLDSIMRSIDSMQTNPPCQIYMSISDRQVLDWHLANLEFANATPLYCLSLKHWDQDDEFEFTGHHLTIRNGYSCLPTALSEGLNIKLSSAAKLIKYHEKGVEVEIQSTNPANVNRKTEIETADAVLVTMPLGCLKEKGPSLFQPPLPDWKSDAIKRLGFGNLNKIVLCFDKIFWDPHINIFGSVPLTTASRGESFLFWNLYKAPVLISLVAGEAASILENVSDDLIVSRCLAVLRAIFSNSQVPHPKEVVVTRWKADPWSRGSYSFVSVDSNGSDYDLLAEPIVPASSSSSNSITGSRLQVPRVFFAGEHTIRNYPATVHGALLSGQREARKIADIFLGSAVTIP